PPSRGGRRGAPDGCARGAGARGSRRRARRGGRSTAARVPQGEARVVARVGVAEGAALFGAGELASGIELDERAHETAEVPAPRGRAQRGGAEPGPVEVEERGAHALGARVDEDVPQVPVGVEHARRVTTDKDESRGGCG